MKINNYLYTNIKKMEGNVLGIGLNHPKLLEALDKNESIIECNLLNSYIEPSNKKGKSKKVQVSKIRKKFKKKNVDYFICRYESVPNIMNILIQDSIYISKKYMYIYASDKEKIEKIKKKYERYQVEIETIKCQDGTILKIECNKAKNYFWKDKIYKVIDYLSNLIDIITELLIN